MKHLIFGVLINCNSYINDLALNFSNPKTQIMVGIMELHDHLMFFILMIFILKIIFFIKSLLSATYYISLNSFRNTLSNTSPSDIKLFNLHYTEANINNRFKNATLLEFIWTILPAIILILMAVPSFILLYAMEESEWPIFNISAIGNQWYRTYEYMDFDIIKYYKIFMKEIADASVRDLSAHIDYIKNFYPPRREGYHIIWEDISSVVTYPYGYEKRDVDIFLYKITFFSNLDEDGQMRFETWSEKFSRETREYHEKVINYIDSFYADIFKNTDLDYKKYITPEYHLIIKELFFGIRPIIKHPSKSYFDYWAFNACLDEVSDDLTTDFEECLSKKQQAWPRRQLPSNLEWLRSDFPVLCKGMEHVSINIGGEAAISPEQAEKAGLKRLPMPDYYKDLSIIVNWATSCIEPYEVQLASWIYFTRFDFVMEQIPVSVPRYVGLEPLIERIFIITDLFPKSNTYEKFKDWNWDISSIVPLWENSIIDDSTLMTLKNNSYFFDSDLEKKLTWKYCSALSFCHIKVNSYISFIDSTYKDIEENVEDTLTIDCQIIPEADLPKGYPRLLCTDQVLVIPSETPLRILVTSNDVIHSRSLPSFGIKMDGIPGRINQILLNTPFFGTVWGQCSELCGINHGFMPIELRVIGLTEFKEYINLMILNSLQELNSNFIKSHSYIGFWLAPAPDNIVSYWEITKPKRRRPILAIPELNMQDLCNLITSNDPDKLRMYGMYPFNRRYFPILKTVPPFKLDITDRDPILPPIPEVVEYPLLNLEKLLVAGEISQFCKEYLRKIESPYYIPKIFNGRLSTYDSCSKLYSFMFIEKFKSLHTSKNE